MSLVIVIALAKFDLSAELLHLPSEVFNLLGKLSLFIGESSVVVVGHLLLLLRFMAAGALHRHLDVHNGARLSRDLAHH